MSSNSGSTILDEPHLPVPGSPSALGTWLFDAETSNNDSDVFFGNGPLTTTSTKPGSECKYLIDTDSEPGYGTPSPWAILNTSLSTTNTHAPRSETPVSDPGPEPRPGSSVLNTSPLYIEVNVAFAHKVRALKHLAHWPYRQISAPTGVALSTGYRIAHTPVTPPYKNMRGWYSILRTAHQERLIGLATASSQNRQKPYLEIA